MNEDRAQKRSAPRPIRFWTLIAILFLTLGGMSSCKKNKEQRADPTQVLSDPTEDSAASLTDAAHGDNMPRGEGIFYNSSQAYARAVGRAPRGRDISLARDSAAASARGNLLKLLKEAGYVPDSTDTLQGATIERYWKKGNFVYAVSVVPLVALSPPLNDSSASSSKEPEGAQPKAAGSPTGGSIP